MLRLALARDATRTGRARPPALLTNRSRAVRLGELHRRTPCRTESARGNDRARIHELKAGSRTAQPLRELTRERSAARDLRVVARAPCSSGTTSTSTGRWRRSSASSSSPGVNPTAAFIFALLAFAAGFAVRPVRRDLLRPARRPRRAEVHLPRHDPDHGAVDVHRRHAAHLRDDRHRGAGDPHPAAAAPGARARRRVRRRGDVRGRARAARQARRVHVVDPDDGDARALPLAARDPGLPHLRWAPSAFEAWGWRIPFLVSLVLLGVSVWIRLKLNESPLFQQMKAEGKGSTAPLTESFGELGRTCSIVLLALFGLTAGQAVVWYAGQFYTLFFLTQTLKVDAADGEPADRRARCCSARPFFLVFGVAVRPHRPQADHHGRAAARGAHLLPDLPRDHALREPGAGGGAERPRR